ncbi:MAG: DUF1566 domain-containing protein [Bacteroides sp.]|nr:DUF1566 domain-containing protein [Bacteroides sp.]
MKNKYLFIIAITYALCVFGAQKAKAQKMYMENNMLILDCTESSGFPQKAVETTMGQKVTTGYTGINETKNKTVYQKLEIAQTTIMGITWSNAKTTCSKKGAGWRLPTQREMQLIAKFSLAITALLGEEGRVTSNNWTLMESGNDNAFFVDGSGYSGITGKNSASINARCVREISVSVTPTMK